MVCVFECEWPLGKSDEARHDWRVRVFGPHDSHEELHTRLARRDYRLTEGCEGLL